LNILHCLAQLPTRTGSGIYYRNLIHQFSRQTDWKQAGLYGLNSNHTVDWPELFQTYPVYFETDELPFPIAGMSDVMPYRSTIYHEMSPPMIEQWQSGFRQQLLQAKRLFKPDVIICHHLWLLCALVREVFPQTYLIGVSHGTDIRQAKQNPRLWREHVGSLETLDLVLSLSQADRPALEEIYQIPPERIEVFGGAYDPAVFYPGDSQMRPGRPIRLIYAGKITDAKGTFELVEAYALARRSIPELELHLVGRVSGDAKTRIKQLSGDDPTIHLFDVETQTQLAGHLRQSVLFVFPSYYEGLGLIALEALASGLHLVSNRLPGLAELLGEDLASHPIIRWVELPELIDLDRIVAESRRDYVDRLAEALLGQIRRIRTGCDKQTFPFEQIRRHSWQALSSRLIRRIEMTKE